MGFFDTEKGVEQYIQMAKGHDGSDLIKILEGVIPAKSKVLEIGMGPGTDLDILDRKFTVTGSDNSDIFLELYKRQNHNADLLKLDAVTLYKDRTFDCIYSNKVLHHITREDLKKSLRRQKEILSPNGVAFHSFWRGDREENFDGLLFTKYQKDGLKEVIGDILDIFEIETYTEMEKDDSIYVVLKKQ